MAIKAFLTPKINFRNFNPSIMISSMFILKKKNRDRYSQNLGFAGNCFFLISNIGKGKK